LASGQAGLRHTSVARCENLNWVRKDRISRGGFSGFVSPALLREVETSLMRALGISKS
jgi:hypothetical protein